MLQHLHFTPMTGFDLITYSDVRGALVVKHCYSWLAISNKRL